MKRLVLILLLPLMVLAACSREVEETPLYHKYAERHNLAVAQVNGFRLCDTVTTDVVILVADDSAAWQGLKEELDIRTSEGVTSWMGDIDQPQQHVKGGRLPAWRAMAVHNERTVAFYRIDNDVQYRALLDYQMNKMEQ